MADTTFGPKGWTPNRLGSLAGKTYVITGGNAGAGFQASRIFLSKGGKVVMLIRSEEKSAAAVKQLKEEKTGALWPNGFDANGRSGRPRHAAFPRLRQGRHGKAVASVRSGKWFQLEGLATLQALVSDKFVSSSKAFRLLGAQPDGFLLRIHNVSLLFHRNQRQDPGHR
ncbi:hypothetical protein GQR58_029742 [Nymphon striatum]|nr:hypothetical protein GQR58_029742 [Nymphon striatum]